MATGETKVADARRRRRKKQSAKAVVISPPTHFRITKPRKEWRYRGYQLACPVFDTAKLDPPGEALRHKKYGKNEHFLPLGGLLSSHPLLGDPHIDELGAVQYVQQ